MKLAHPDTVESESSETDRFTSRHELPLKRRRIEDDTEDDDKESDDASETDDDRSSDDGNSDDEDEESNEVEGEEEDEDENSEVTHTEDPEDNQAYQDWLEHAMTETAERRSEKYEKYISEGLTDEEAKEKAHFKLLWAVKRIFFDDYSNFLQQNIHLDEDETHQKIMSDLQSKIENGMNIKDAISRTLVKHIPKFEGLFNYQSESEDDQSESGEDEDWKLIKRKRCISEEIWPDRPA